MPVRILVADQLADAGVQALAAHHDVDVRTGRGKDEILADVADYDAIVVRSATTIDADVIAAASNLKVIGRAGVGLDNVDIEAATEAGVIVCNAPTSNVISAAEHTVAMITSLARNIPQAHKALTAGRWERSRWKGTELHGKTLGILGLGRIGSLVAERCAALGMDLVAYDPFVSPERAEHVGVALLDTVEEVLAVADVVTIHLPRNADTVGLLDARHLAMMKPGAYLVNVARGGIVVEEDLAAALSDEVLAGAAIDVFATEPTTASPLFALDNVVVTPHLGASTAEAQDKAGVQVAESVNQALDGQLVPSAVNVAGGPIDPRFRGYLDLGEVLGRLFGGLSGGLGREVSIEYLGGLAEVDTAVVGLSVLKGLLGSGATQPVTFVNAPAIARDRGLHLRETTDTQSPLYLSLLRVSGTDREGREVRVAGTVLPSSGRLRFVEVWNTDLDVEPADRMAFFRYRDRPGVMGTVGTILGEEGVNIASAQVGRLDDERAVIALSLDDEVTTDAMDRIATRIGADEHRSVLLT